MVMDKSHLTEEELKEPCIMHWVKQKELELDEAVSDQVLPKTVTRGEVTYVYAWITPVKYNLTKIYGRCYGDRGPDLYSYFYLARAYPDGYIMSYVEGKTILNSIYSFSSKKAALKAKEKAIKYFEEEMKADHEAHMRNFGKPWFVPGDSGINSLLLSKHLELLQRCKLYKIKMINKPSWELTEEE